MRVHRRRLSRTHRSRPSPSALAMVTAVAGIGGMAALLATAAWRIAGAGASYATRSDDPITARIGVAAALSAADPRGFARALAPRQFAFPADHGPHPDFHTEWWYYTGNLAARDGRRFGFQLTFFRIALAPPPPPGERAAAGPVQVAPSLASSIAPGAGAPPAPAPAAGLDRAAVRVAAYRATGRGVSTPPQGARTSAWATRQVYFAHFAVTDVSGHRFQAYERWERQALGLSGAQASPFRVWVGDWSAAAAPATTDAPATVATPRSGTPPLSGTPPMRLSAVAASDDAGATARSSGSGAAAIDLVLTANLPPVPQGDHGLSAKSAAPGNASYYYSLPRLSAAGTLRLGAETIDVAGLAWMDREWSTSSLAPGEVGWDWLALQLDDGWELMLYRLRRRPGAAARSAAAGRAGGADLADPASRATLIGPDGHTELFPPAAWRLEATDYWTSPATHTRYPAGWRLTLPAAGAAALDLVVRPLLADQELPLSLRYWEGAVDARGTHGGHPITARGYVELTGYGDALPLSAAAAASASLPRGASSPSH